jgi:methylthioribose-1-phosphate isomerase
MTSHPFTHDTIRAVQWHGDHLRCSTSVCCPPKKSGSIAAMRHGVFHAIKDLAVRGAPAIGIAAAWGVVLAAKSVPLDQALAHLRSARPTAVNLMWALDRMKARIAAGADAAALEREAQAIQDEDLAANRHMGELGAALIAPGSA